VLLVDDCACCGFGLLIWVAILSDFALLCLLSSVALLACSYWLTLESKFGLMIVEVVCCFLVLLVSVLVP
jgi:hypothetical protein